MNVIDYLTITCNLKNVRLQITFDYMKNVIDYNRLRWQITIPHVCFGITFIRYIQCQNIWKPNNLDTFFYWRSCSEQRNLSVMYMYVRGIDCGSVSTIMWLDFGIALTMWNALYYILMQETYNFNSVDIRRVWRYQMGSQNPYIVEEQTTQWPKEKVQKDKKRSTKHTYKTKDRVTRTPLKTGGELITVFVTCN
jgi:hypothetical protein